MISPISAIDQALNNSNLPNIMLTPNPAQTFLKIQAEFDLTDTKYTVYNVNGERICKGELNKLTNQISIKHLNDGIYLLKLNGKRYSFTNKFVKKSN